MQATQILQNALEPSTQQAAEEQLRAASESNFPVYMVTMCQELHEENRPPQTRRLAGILMKNAVDAKDRRTRQQFKDRWLNVVDDASKEQIKQLLLFTLASPVKEANNTAAMVIAKIATIELPLGRWEKLIATLLDNMTKEQATVHSLEGTLDALGFICEEAVEDELDAGVLASHSSQILSAVVTGMRFEGPDPGSSVAVRKSAVTALLNALEFVRDNFAVERERTYIMENVCDCTTHLDAGIRKTAFECLVKIAEVYYGYLDMYMNILYELTVTAIRRDEDPVALQAIEFWSTIAEEELAIFDEVPSRDSNTSQKRFVVRALEQLCPVIFECLMQQEELQDDDTWNKATAAGTCLDLLAECAPQKILEYVVPFVQENITAQGNWRAREAAIMAFGSILEGPSPEQLDPLVEKALPLMLTILSTDENSNVRDTAAWTIGRVCHISKGQVSRNLKTLVESLLKALKDEPNVAKNACWAFHNVAELYEDDMESHVGSLSEYVEAIMTGLLDATMRNDADDFNLRPSAYEALSMLIQYMPQGNMAYVQQIVPLLVQRLEATLQTSGLTAEDQAAIADSQGLLCGALQIATQRLKREGIISFADRMMESYHLVLNQGRNASVSEEVLMAIGAVADALEGDFVKYVEVIMPFLLAGLRSWDQYQVCSVAVGVIGDVCRAIEKKIMPYADVIVQSLLTALGNDDLDKSVKPPMLSCLGDIALAVGGDFDRYLSHVMVMLRTAAEMSVSSNHREEDYDMIDWLLQLRSSIFEAYTGILQGLKNDNRHERMREHNEWMLHYCKAVWGDEVTLNANRVLGEKQLSQAAGVLGDMATTTDGAAVQLQAMPWVSELLEKIIRSDDANIRSTGLWAKATIEQTQ